MIHFVIPYSFNKKLFEAYDFEFTKIADENDWVCFTDGDTLFFENNFGHQVQEYIDKYPDTGIFTCYSSRCAYPYMVHSGTLQESDSITYHRNRSKDIYEKFHLQVKEIHDPIAGHLMCIKKSTWQMIRPKLLKLVDGANLLGVDTQISNLIIAHGFKIRLMQGIYLFHYYRLVEGRKYKGHLMEQTLNVLIRTSNRPVQFKRCIESVRNQTYKQVNILVSADDENTAKYVRSYGIEPLMVRKKLKSKTETAPYNSYLNELMEQVKGGWIFILDDDDYLADNSVFEKLVENLTDDNVIYFVKMRWANGRIIPSSENFANKQIVRKDIGMPCFIFHAKHKHKVSFELIQQSDYHFISRLATIVKRQSWIDIIFTQIGNTGAYGKPED